MNTFKVSSFCSLLFIFLMSSFSVSAQFKVNSSGNIELGSATNTIGTLNTVPISFKVNNVLTGFTGTASNGNVSFGYYSLPNSSGGDSNTAVGHSALSINTSGYHNTAIGRNALFLSMTGSGNTAIGSSALSYNPSGNYNTIIGYEAGNLGTDQTNSIAIGYLALATSSNQARIGNYSTISIGGYVAWSNVSDGRVKKNIRLNVPGLEFINSLQPVTYNFDLGVLDELQKSDDPKINTYRDSLRMARSPEEKEIEARSRAKKEMQVYSGFIAQDVEKAARSVGYNFSGVDAPENGKGMYGLRYAEFVVPLVKAVQELSEQNDQLQKQVNELTGLVYKLLEKEDAVVFRSENSTTGLPESTGIKASLEQNIPNPFNQTTVVRYTLPQSYNSAQIVITNASGVIVKKIPLFAGSNNITIEGGSMQAGIYFYSLICDGNVVDTKRMILTK